MKTPGKQLLINSAATCVAGMTLSVAAIALPATEGDEIIGGIVDVDVTVQQLIHFDDANNGWSWYSTADRNFLFDPTNFQSSTLCADSTSGGNGSCLIETRQGEITTMTRPTTGTTNQGEANPNIDPDSSGPDLPFTLDSIYFLLTGNGEGAANAITITGSNSASTTFQLGGNYTDVTFYEGPDEGDLAGPLVKNTGYIATFGSLFENVTSITFTAATSANVRLDCITASFVGTTSEPTSAFPDHRCGITDGEPPVSVPEPGVLALLATGLFGIFSIRRKPQV